MRRVTRNLARPVALGVIRVDDELLVLRGYDHVKDQTYYRPLGGTIEFGEHSEAAMRRELREELDITVVHARLLGVVENTFTVNGAPGHEIDFMYEVSVAEIDRLRSGPIIATEADGSPLICVWRPLSAFGSVEPLYPPGLLELLR
jgi:ADP-ribose pyrophosphatase YjhB (NUDIX family)